MIKSLFLFVLAGLAEIGGGYLVWLWIREKKQFLLGLVGGIILVLYGIIPTLQDYPNFGRVYAVWWDLHYIIITLGLGCG